MIIHARLHPVWPPPEAASAPLAGAVNVTVTPVTGLFPESSTVAWSDVANVVLTVALCGACLKACEACERSCNETFHYCYTQVAAGKKEYAKALHLVADCAKFCDLSADLAGVTFAGQIVAAPKRLAGRSSRNAADNTPTPSTPNP